MFSISLESSEVKGNASACQAIVDEINTLLSGLSSDPSLSLEAAARQVSAAKDKVGQKVLELFVSESAGVHSRVPVACPEPGCEELCRPWRKKVRRVSTRCGVIRVVRWVHRCGSGHTHVPWDSAEGLRGQYTRSVSESMCRLASRLDFREASEELSHQGIKVSHTTLHQKVREWASELSVPAVVNPQKLLPNERWYIACDGCHTNSLDGWKEIKVGCVYRDYPQPPPCPGAIPSARTDSIRYIASRDTAADFGKALYELATNSGIYKENIGSEEIIFIGDGAAWIWNLADEYFPNAVQIVDYMHAKSHLYTVAKVAFGETETEAIEAWVKATEPLLADGNITELAERIRTLDAQTPEGTEGLQREARYFEKHAKRMQYKTFREKGYQIGSGVIESACKHVVAQRCKQAGMRWDKPGIDAVLAWRCLDKNNAWNDYWYPNTKAA